MYTISVHDHNFDLFFETKVKDEKTAKYLFGFYSRRFSGVKAKWFSPKGIIVLDWESENEN